MFPQLTKDELLQIVDLFIKRLGERLLDRDMTIELTAAAKEQLIEVGFDPTLGARPLRRAVQHEIEDRLSEQILHGELNAGDHVHVDFAGRRVRVHDRRRAASRSRRASTPAAAIGTGPATPDLAANGGLTHVSIHPRAGSPLAGGPVVPVLPLE